MKNADGSDAHTATVTVKNANDSPVAGITVIFSDIPDASCNPPSGHTNAQGLFETHITSTVPGTRTVRVIASVGVVEGNLQAIEFGSVQLVLEMAPDNGLVSDTEKNNWVLATVLMADGSPAPQGTRVTFDAVDDVVFNATACLTAGSSGRCLVMLGSTVAKTYSISAHVPGVLSAAQVDATFIHGPYDLAASTLEPITGDKKANGVDAHVATVTLRDTYGNPYTATTASSYVLFPAVSGVTIDPTAPDRCEFVPGSATTSARITSELEGTYSITATSGSGAAIGQPQTARFVGVTADESRSTFSVSEGSQPADGVTPHTVTAFIRDADDTPFAGATVYFGTTDATLLERTCITGPDGTCSVYLVATTAGTKEVRANLDRRVDGALVYLSNNPQSAQFS
nr:Ig-like domain-containing protein [Pseudomonas batumici]